MVKPSATRGGRLQGVGAFKRKNEDDVDSGTDADPAVGYNSGVEYFDPVGSSSSEDDAKRGVVGSSVGTWGAGAGANAKPQANIGSSSPTAVPAFYSPEGKKEKASASQHCPAPSAKKKTQIDIRAMFGTKSKETCSAELKVATQ